MNDPALIPNICGAFIGGALLGRYLPQSRLWTRAFAAVLTLAAVVMVAYY